MECTICSSSDTKRKLTLESGKMIYECNRCSNAFTYPKPNVPDYTSEDFHANGSATDKLLLFEELPEEIQVSYNIQTQLIEEHVTKGESILEIGGGEGILAERLLKRGHRIEMNEPSLTAASRARKKGIKVYNNYFQKTSFDSTYALINMAHVLEHIEDPLKTIEDIKRLLNPNGFLMLTQTNFKGFMPFFLRDKWYAWVPDQHFSHFSIRGIKYIAKKLNMQVIAYKYSRLYHGKSVYHETLRYIPWLQDQIHVLLKLKS